MTEQPTPLAGPTNIRGKERADAATVTDIQAEASPPALRRWGLFSRQSRESNRWLDRELTPRLRAQLLYDYCVASEKKVSETVHNLFIIAEHYEDEHAGQIDDPEKINGIPRFFGALTPAQKSHFCYNKVTEELSLEALPVTVESLRATKREFPSKPASSYAGMPGTTSSPSVNQRVHSTG